MEFQEAVMKLTTHKTHKRNGGPKLNRWTVISFRKSPKPSKPKTDHRPREAMPDEFLCPVSGSLMADPVIVPSGHSFERASVEACKSLGFVPPGLVADVTAPDFSTLIPNHALKSTILSFCRNRSLPPPKPLDLASAYKLVADLMSTHTHKTQKKLAHSTIEERRDSVREEREMRGAKTESSRSHHDDPPTATHSYSSSDDSVATTTAFESTPPLQLAARPSCCCSSSCSSSEFEPSNPEEEELLAKLKSPLVFDVEEAVIALRDVTRTSEESRVPLCTARLLSSIRPLIVSKYCAIQVNSVASLVNLSLAVVNKVKIVRSGIVPNLIDVLKGGFPEAAEHAAGVLFSLALDDGNKTAIGALGALPPLLHALRSESERARGDSASALYHLSLVQSNRVKLVRIGSVPVLVGMVRSGHLAGRALLVLVNLGLCAEGRGAMMDAGGVECLVGFLSRAADSTRDNCVTALYVLSQGGLRFKALAKAAGAAEALEKVESGRWRAREMARRMVEMMGERRGEIDGEDVDWEKLLEAGTPSR
ncbi:U-box domain-containing protein 40-like [Rhodamnia argentea]|uniref:RING-type E3 ubiquitin transferase n=1 Tax=Rhodamnia argentea TaxID=178133 RepID=A0A8B8R2C6_9MYRT|nr:U-box domain-containing protein 40-like [Rhodamnia argentea]